MEGLERKPKDFKTITVDARGRSRGIAMPWKNRLDVSLLSISLNHADVWATTRRSTNFISSLIDEDGLRKSEYRDIESIVIRYFNNLFSSSWPTDLDAILQHVQPRVTPSMNCTLTTPWWGGLIDFDRVCWNENTTRSSFLLGNADLIFSLPLCPSWPSDQLIWHHSADRV
ncbi:hypothetical protein Cgig2_013897 [Carnegiea gigantea]|uniref:Uncharacterized protein n=1 Tax=Carnegiea gigantea TaxID=171969 RepID=A0A9Q1JW96_9CARY|nr:hypothetical protein Cgig2_013897 [Carnegiea gigantea]